MGQRPPDRIKGKVSGQTYRGFVVLALRKWRGEFLAISVGKKREGKRLTVVPRAKRGRGSSFSSPGRGALLMW